MRIDFKNLLFVPATVERLKKVKEINNDVFIFDLEDSILVSDKEEALIRLKKFLETNDKKETKWIARVNLENIYREIDYLKENVDGFLIPKVENTELIKKIRKENPNKIILALIETPMGIINLKNIASDSSIDALVFGAEDFTSSINMENLEENLNYIKVKILLYGKAYNKKVFDTPSFEIKNLDKLERDIKKSKSLGFDGKLLIHPKQIEIMNKIYKYDYNKIKTIIRKFEESNQGVLCFEDKVYEITHIKQLKKILQGEKNEFKR